MTSTKKINKKTLDKNKTKKHKINNKGGFDIGDMHIKKNLEKARDYFKPHENAGKKCDDVNDCILQPNNGNMAIPDNSIDCIDGNCRTKSIKGTAAKVLNNRLKDLTSGFTTFFEGKESKTEEGNESDTAKNVQQGLLQEQCNITGKHIVALYNIGNTTQCLVYDKEHGIIKLVKKGEENSNLITIPEHSNADAILEDIQLKNMLFQDIIYDNLQNIDKNQNNLKQIRQNMYKSVEQKIKEKININTNIDNITILNKKVLPDQSSSKSSDEKDKQDKELLNEINDINIVKKNNKGNPNIISQAKNACINIKNNKSNVKNYKTYISSLTHFMLYHTFYFYKKDDGTSNTLQNAIINDIDKITISMANVHTAIKLSIPVEKGINITDEEICDFFSKQKSPLTRQAVYDVYTSNKNATDDDADEEK
uniref:Uncharacterized protein n=1 Tax=viral metagenome TaxID=1070528 RepID=A0A6C0C0D0_9ZZZZ